MKMLKKAISYLNEQLNENSFQVWIGHQNNQKHVYSNGQNVYSSPPIFSLIKPLNTYRLNNDRETYIYFCYPEEFYVCLCTDVKSPLSNEDINQLYYYFYPLYSWEIIQKRDDEWKTVMETTRSINSSIDTDQILINIVQNAIKVIPAADKGYLQLFDEEKERLVLKASVGFNENINKFQTRTGESITGMTFLDGRPRIYHSGEEILEAMFRLNVTKENYHYMDNAFGIRSLGGCICVAISIGEKRIGNMMVQQFTSQGTLSERDITLLEGFAAQAAIAIQNASLVSKIKNNVAELTELSDQLMEKNSVLQYRNQVHETMTEISLKNKGFETIISELSRMTDAPIALFDNVEDDFVCSLKSQNHIFEFEEIRKNIHEIREPHYLEAEGECNIIYYLYPIKNGTAFLGYVIVATEHPLSDMNIVTIEQGAAILSLELVKKNTLTDIYYKKTHESFTDFINNNHIDSLHGQAKELGLDPSHYFCVSVFRIKAGQDLQALELNIHRLVSFIKKSFPNLNLLVYGFHNKVNLLISTPHLSDQERMSEKLDDLMMKWQQNGGTTFAAGIGSTYRGIGNIATSYDEAQKALEYLINRNDSAIIHYEKIGINRLFVHQQPQEIEFFLEETLTPLSSEKDNKELEETLVSYIQLNKSAVATAKKLHIHINTLYNRLKKIEELLDISFQNPEDNLKIQLACHLRGSYKMR